ncbi:MBOAT family O-acyltransferase [Mucilaginibacter sp. UYCu711]|uniref:MBOAT family O-acyltransferase n=1 Tax=Mucilaginibacter sp. UYCu711 TaxID=3156339 RepID=UPI003D23482F
MLFNSIPFAIFFSAFFLLYWFLFRNNLRWQNLSLLFASYLFYYLMDSRFLLLLIFNSLINFLLGRYIAAAKEQKRKSLLANIGVIIGLGQLIYFKYFNFFIESFTIGLNKLGLHADVHLLNIILPLGVSFYTFKIIGYLIDIKNGKINAVDDWCVFFTYVGFFPAIIAGPIDKSKVLIPQLQRRREFDFDDSVDAIKQIGWGLFKKVVIADNLTLNTDAIFTNYQHQNGSTLLLISFLYSIQLYADFSGYSDMAIGISRLLGLKITKNFDYPFFAQNTAQFWRKWHMSLTQWLTEYLFTPLTIAFRDMGKSGLMLAVFINFITIGFWHGAKWTYGAFGLIHAIYFIPLIITGKVNKNKKITHGKLLPSPTEFFNILSTFFLVNIAFIFFRADNLSMAFGFIKGIMSISLFHIPDWSSKHSLGFLVMFIVIEWLGRDHQYGLAKIGGSWPAFIRWGFYYFIFWVIFFFAGSNQNFIYVQF